MDWTDYGRVAFAVAFAVLCAAFTFALVNLVWLKGPWEPICAFLVFFVCSEVRCCAVHWLRYIIGRKHRPFVSDFLSLVTHGNLESLRWHKRLFVCYGSSACSLSQVWDSYIPWATSGPRKPLIERCLWPRWSGLYWDRYKLLTNLFTLGLVSIPHELFNYEIYGLG